MGNIRKLLFIVLAVSFVGCATAPTPEQLANADYGFIPDDHEQAIKNYMRTVLKDPDSAQYVFRGRPQKMWLREYIGGPLNFGWGTCAAINAKNSFGAYVGYQEHFFLLKDEKVIVAPGPGIVSQNTCRKR